MCGRGKLSPILISVWMLQLKTSAGAACFNNTDCSRAGERSSECCNGTCLDRCGSAKCRFDAECDVGHKCCDSGECISRVSLCTLSSKLAVAIPLSLLFFFALVVCVCSHHPSCPVYKTNQRRRTGTV